MTVQEYLNAALVRNRKTQEKAQVSAGGAEVVSAFNRALRGYFTVGARVNPAYFGKKAEDVALSAGAYPRPTDAELVYLIRDEDGDRVHQVPVDQPDAEIGPRVYRWGRTYVPVDDSVDGALDIWYSARPSAASTLSSEVDALWEDQFAELMVLELAAWLAHRDERWNDVQALVRERDRWLQLFVTALGHESVAEVRETGHDGVFGAPPLSELSELLLVRPSGGG